MKSYLSRVVFLAFLTTGVLCCFVAPAAADDECTRLKRACASYPDEGRKACFDKSEEFCRALECNAQIILNCQTLDKSDCFMKTTCTDEKCKDQAKAEPEGTCDAYAASWRLQVPVMLLIVCSSLSAML